MIIYKTTNLVNGKIYIGQDKNNNHTYLGSGKILHLAFQKHGIENFNKEIIEECESIEELNEREKYWISFYNSTNRSIGYNIALGGNGGDTLSKHPNKKEIGNRIGESNKRLWEDEVYKTKMSEIRKNQVTEETREKLSKLSKGENNPNYGKHHSEEIKNKIRTKAIGRIVTEETRKKISEANTGKLGNNWSDEQKRNHSKLMSEKNPFKGKTHTNEVKQRISEANKKPKSKEHKRKISETLKGNKPGNMVQVEIEGMLYESVTDASIKTGINMSTLRNRIKSKSDKYKNYKLCKIDY